jgi:hypothetical protein
MYSIFSLFGAPFKPNVLEGHMSKNQPLIFWPLLAAEVVLIPPLTYILGCDTIGYGWWKTSQDLYLTAACIVGVGPVAWLVLFVGWMLMKVLPKHIAP